MSTLYTFASAWCQKQPAYFTAEDMKKAYFEAGHPAPPNVNHFGLVIKKLSKEGVIQVRSFKKAEMPLAKGRIICVWVATKTSVKQQLNRKQNGYGQGRLF